MCHKLKARRAEVLLRMDEAPACQLSGNTEEGTIHFNATQIIHRKSIHPKHFSSKSWWWRLVGTGSYVWFILYFASVWLGINKIMGETWGYTFMYSRLNLIKASVQRLSIFLPVLTYISAQLYLCNIGSTCSMLSLKSHTNFLTKLNPRTSYLPEFDYNLQHFRNKSRYIIAIWRSLLILHCNTSASVICIHYFHQEKVKLGILLHNLIRSPAHISLGYSLGRELLGVHLRILSLILW